MFIARIKQRVTFTVSRNGKFEGESLAILGLGEIGDVILRGVIFDAIFSEIFVHLIHGLNRLGGGECRKGRGRATFPVAVIHHADGRGNALDQDRIIAGC